MTKKITANNIKNFIQGNYRRFKDKIMTLEPHIREQVIYRSSFCDDCLKAGYCGICGCPVPGRWYATKTCSDRFPNLMDKITWEEYKKENNIEIDENNL